MLLISSKMIHSKLISIDSYSNYKSNIQFGYLYTEFKIIIDLHKFAIRKEIRIDYL